MLETGIVPDDWKKAKVHPIFKSDKINILSSHRPISILPAISKIIESSGVRVFSSRQSVN